MIIQKKKKKEMRKSFSTAFFAIKKTSLLCDIYTYINYYDIL